LNGGDPAPAGNATFAEAARAVPLGWLWTGAVLIAGIVVGIFDPVEALNEVIENQGLSSEQVATGAFIAGFTAPLAAATALVVYLALAGYLARWGSWNAVAAVSLIYLAAGFLSAELGLGLAPTTAFDHIEGNPRIALPLNTFLSFFTAYGFPLMVAGGVLGSAGGFTAWRLLDADDPADPAKPA
jgi:hypothetical protein